MARLVLLVSVLVSGCTSFSTLRSAEVVPGPSFLAQASISTPPGDAAAWFWSYDCAQSCNHAVAGAELSLTHGVIPRRGGAPFSIGVGLNGVYPFAEAYVQLVRRENHAFGVGLRPGIPVSGSAEHRAYLRYDDRVGHVRLLVNPGIIYLAGNSPNGENPGHFIGFAGGLGFMIEGRSVDFVPGASLVVGHTNRSSYNLFFTSGGTTFATISMSIVIHRARDR